MSLLASSSEPSPSSYESHTDTASSSTTSSPCTCSILLIGDIDHAKEEWAQCAEFATLLTFQGQKRAQFLSDCGKGIFDNVSVIYRSNESTKLTGPFDSELVDYLPANIKYICHNGAGYDNIDVAACTKRGISVSHTPRAANDATADMSMFLILGALRRVHIPYTAIRQGQWRGRAGLGHDPKGKILGILGMGEIGSAVALRAKAFGMKVQYHNRSPLPPSRTLGAEYVSFDTLLATSDVLSLNLSLTPQTKKIISKPEFDKMKTGVVIVNTARGPLVNDADLLDALKSGKVYSAGLDVFDEEPQVHPALLQNENVVLLPHIGTATFETQKAMELLVLDNVRSAIKEGRLVTPVPEQRKKQSII